MNPTLSLFETALASRPASQRPAVTTPWQGRGSLTVVPPLDAQPGRLVVDRAAAPYLLRLCLALVHAVKLARPSLRFCRFVGGSSSAGRAANFSRSGLAKLWPPTREKVLPPSVPRPATAIPYEDLA